MILKQRSWDEDEGEGMKEGKYPTLIMYYVPTAWIIVSSIFFTTGMTWKEDSLAAII